MLYKWLELIYDSKDHGLKHFLFWYLSKIDLKKNAEAVQPNLLH